MQRKSSLNPKPYTLNPKLQAESDRATEAKKHKEVDTSEKHYGRTATLLNEIAFEYDQSIDNMGEMLQVTLYPKP